MINTLVLPYLVDKTISLSTRIPTTQAQFVECLSEELIRNGIPAAVVDDPLFRKVLVITSRMGQTTVCMVKGTALGKRDTTLTHHYTFTRKIIPTDRQEAG